MQFEITYILVQNRIFLFPLARNYFQQSLAKQQSHSSYQEWEESFDDGFERVHDEWVDSFQAIHRAHYHIKSTDEDSREAAKVVFVLDGNQADTNNNDVQFTQSAYPETAAWAAFKHVEKQQENTERAKAAAVRKIIFFIFTWK